MSKKRKKGEYASISLMARRPDFGKRYEVLSRQDLAALRDSLAHLSDGHVRDFYQRAYERCRLTSRDFPPARAIQELVQAWKLLRKWRG
jgi:hypothetical protein